MTSHDVFGHVQTTSAGNDDDIGALGSILSWNEDEEVDDQRVAEESQRAGGHGNGEDGTSSNFLAQLAADIAAGNSNTNQRSGSNAINGAIPQIALSSPANMNMFPSQLRSIVQPQAQQAITAAQQNAQMQQNPSNFQQGQVINQTHPGQPGFPVFQLPSFQQPAPTLGQPHATPHPMQVPSMPHMPAQVQMTQQYSMDPNAFLRQFQAAQQHAQAQQQQAQQNSQQLKQPQQPTQQQASEIRQFQQQSQTSQSQQQPAPQQIASPSLSPRSKPKVLAQPQGINASRWASPVQNSRRTTSFSSPQITSTLSSSALNVVSCSDTDGEAQGKSSDGAGATESYAKSLKITTSSNKSSSLSLLDIGEEDDDMKSTCSDGDTTQMTPTEKAKANRDRNREHARNTRLRKKAYLEKLKQTVDELCRERDTLVSERANAATLIVEMHNTRAEVLMSFFALRSSNEHRRELWASILDESCFSCILPVTPYRSFPASEVQVSKCQRTILGIDSMMSDAASLHVLLNSLINRSHFPDASIKFQYTLVTEDAVVAGNQMMARWIMSTLNATEYGARMEVSKQGMLCCKFNSTHKIVSIELMFDVMAFMLQIKQATGTDTFAVNKLWEEMTGHKAENVVNKASCRILQGSETDQRSLGKLMSEVRFKRPASGTILNYTQSGRGFRNFMLLYPLSTDSKITHYLGLTTHIEWLDSGVSSHNRILMKDVNNSSESNSQEYITKQGGEQHQDKREA
eukprot:scaffold711241_cov59-Attheya_sp.AAC.1